MNTVLNNFEYKEPAIYMDDNLMEVKEITVNSKTNKRYLFIKRLIDVIVSFIGLIVLSPLLAIISIIVALDSKGPVMFAQNRVGENGKIFTMYKYRTMHIDAGERQEEVNRTNELNGPIFKMKDDPRITNAGRYLRKITVDEFPQLWNVLKGEMTLVGPRPMLIEQVEQYTPYEKQRILVKPGCTGLWQVSGRSNLDFDEMIDLDLKYIENRSLVLDIKIILKTFVVIFTREGAY